MLEEFSKRLGTWCIQNYLKLETTKDDFIFKIGDKLFVLVLPNEDGKVINKHCCFFLTEEDLQDIEFDYFLFEFGGKWYYNKLKEFVDKDFNEIYFEADFNDLKYLGEADINLKYEFVNLGVHSEYELLNGSHKADLWSKKAKFLGQKAIAICDKNTLAGCLSMQLACEKLEMKSIIGYTATVAEDYDKDKDVQTTYEIKLYVTNEQGWQNLLQVNKCINVDYDGFIPEENLWQLGKGLIAILSTNNRLNYVNNATEGYNYIIECIEKFEEVYYQIDSVEFYSDKDDLKILNQYKFYLENYVTDLKPILINDCYYADREMFILKEMLNKVDRKAYSYSENQHFKTLDENFLELGKLFKNKAAFKELFDMAVSSTVKVSNLVDFKINTGEAKFPKYKFLNGKTNVDLFFELLNKGFDKKITPFFKGKKLQEYYERVEKECKVILGGGDGFIDYFLILWDIVKWSKDNGIIVGTGRGSVGGCLLAFLLDIITVDPVKNNLLFERFMNETRAIPQMFYIVDLTDGRRIELEKGKNVKLINEKEKLVDDLINGDELVLEKFTAKVKSVSKDTVGRLRGDQMPDIDIDFPSNRREDVKEYIKERFGKLHTCSIGTFTRLKLKGAVKAFAREKGLSFSYVNHLTKDIDDELDYSFRDLIRYSLNSKDLYEFVQKYPDIIHCIKYCLGQACVPSIHASAVIIVPEKNFAGEDVNIFNWLPMRKIGDKLISEWEGKYTDKAGFLKEDILGLKQLDKFKRILELIKRNLNKDIVIEDIPLDDENVYALFKKGYNEDVFQFTSSGLKSYSKDVRPDTLDELTAMTALYRPGPMDSNAHKDFALIKHGKKKPQFDRGFENIAEKTFGLLIYQEQIMQALVVGGLSLVDSDRARNAIKKFDKKLMDEFKLQFIKGLTKDGINKVILDNGKVLYINNDDLKKLKS